MMHEIRWHGAKQQLQLLFCGSIKLPYGMSEGNVTFILFVIAQHGHKMGHERRAEASWDEGATVVAE